MVGCPSWGQQLGQMKGIELILRIKEDFCRQCDVWPGVKLVWSDMKCGVKRVPGWGSSGQGQEERELCGVAVHGCIGGCFR